MNESSHAAVASEFEVHFESEANSIGEFAPDIKKSLSKHKTDSGDLRERSPKAYARGENRSLRRHLQIEEMSPNGLVTLLEGPDIDRARSNVVGYGQRFGVLCHIDGFQIAAA